MEDVFDCTPTLIPALRLYVCTVYMLTLWERTRITLPYLMTRIKEDKYQHVTLVILNCNDFLISINC